MDSLNEMEQRLRRVEEKVQYLSHYVLDEPSTNEALPWWKKRAELFKDHLDLYDQAAELGRAWREETAEEVTKTA
jgi:hypothetical protein